MKMRSTGLGTTELVGEINDITRAGGYLVLHVGTTDPVRWHVRAAMSFGDLLKMICLLLKPSRLYFLLAFLFHFPKKETNPDF